MYFLLLKIFLALAAINITVWVIFWPFAKVGFWLSPGRTRPPRASKYTLGERVIGGALIYLVFLAIMLIAGDH